MRPDKRDSAQIRALSCAQNVLSRADGSARFDFGKTSVLCSVHGPAEVRLREEKLDKATLDISILPLKGISGTKDRVVEYFLRSTLEPVILTTLHPRTCIQVIAQVLQNDGCVLSAVINAASLALINAGIPMRSVPASVSCIVKDGNIILDPAEEEMENSTSTHTFSFDSEGQLLLCESLGSFTDTEFDKCLSLCLDGVKKVHGFMRMALEKKMEKEHQQRCS
ncbi:uncharacterized protein VTP21DRAFT_5463 [Calcarisporiella thermophila]|uniref:uncharacterized protein n=1 Tax=Calcarisporiella thermophila TaxID=911321 RepID=UPI0037427E86